MKHVLTTLLISVTFVFACGDVGNVLDAGVDVLTDVRDLLDSASDSMRSDARAQPPRWESVVCDVELTEVNFDTGEMENHRFYTNSALDADGYEAMTCVNPASDRYENRIAAMTHCHRFLPFSDQENRLVVPCGYTTSEETLVLDVFIRPRP